MYHFVDLTDAQKYRRRELLDFYGQIAQISVLAPLLALQIWFAANWAWRRWGPDRHRDLEGAAVTPSSPYLKQRRLGFGGGGWIARWRGWVWAADEQVVLGKMEVGTRGEVVGAVVWLVWLVGLCFVQTGDDYLHLTKRFGIVAGSQLPIHYLLALKSSYSPLQILTRSSHDRLNIIHQFLGRIITILLYLHAILYLNFYIQSDLLLAKLTQFYVICGIIGILSFSIIATTALDPVRRWSYRVFYIVHVTLATALLPVLFFHVSHIRIYLYETAIVYAAGVALRYFSTKSLPPIITLVPGTTDLVEVRFPLPPGSEHGAKLQHHVQPGQHFYLSLPPQSGGGGGGISPPALTSNPFTASSLLPTDREVTFHARVYSSQGSRTSRLASLASSEPAATALSQQLKLEGPYGVRSHNEHLLRFERVLLVAGGVGATFILPVYRRLLADLSPSAGSARRQRVRCVWAVRRLEETGWALKGLEKAEANGVRERLGVWVTRATGQGNESRRNAGSGSVGRKGMEDNEEDDDGEEGIELLERRKLLNGSDESSWDVGRKRGDVEDGLNVNSGRPDLARLVDEAFSHGAAEKVAVMVCGPKGMGRRVKKEVGRWVGRGREVWFWEEKFAL